MRTAEAIKSRIALLESRHRDNGNIIKKLQRELRKIAATQV